MQDSVRGESAVGVVWCLGVAFLLSCDHLRLVSVLPCCESVLAHATGVRSTDLPRVVYA